MPTEFIKTIAEGFAFGFLLQRAHVARYDTIMGGLQLKDMTIIKFMLSHIIVGMIGVNLLSELGMIELDVKPFVAGANIVGGLLFGVGFAIMGYCPGTAIAAMGEGRLDALFGALPGMIAGAALYAHSYNYLRGTSLLTAGDLGELTIPDVLHVNRWLVIVSLALLILLLFRWFEKNNR